MASIQTSPTTNTGIKLQQLLTLCVAIGCGALWAFESASIVKAHLNHDAGWYLYVADAVLHGAQLDGHWLVEVNPPGLVRFFMIPALLAHALHISLAAGFRAFVILSATALIAWSASLFRRIFKASPLMTWLFVLCAMYAVGNPISVEDRGQREYFVAIFLLPYVLWAAARLRDEVLSPVETLLIAIFAAAAICLKPQHVIDAVAVELLVLLRLRNLRRWFRPALLLIAAGPPLYILTVSLFVPSYLHNVVPLLRETYWGFNRPLSSVLHTARKPLVAFGVGIVLYAALRRRLRFESFVACLLAASAGGLFAYVHQHKGWSYHLLVFQILSYLAVAVLCIDVAERVAFERRGVTLLAGTGRLHTIALVSTAILAFIITGQVCLSHMQAIDYPQEAKSELASIYSAYPAGTPVGFLAIDSWQWPAILEQNKIFASRYMQLWLLPAIVRSQDPLDTEVARHLSPEKIDEFSTLLRQTTAEDLDHWRPPVVVIDPCAEVINLCGGLSRAGYSGLLDWFNRDPQFLEQWSHYRFQKTVGQMQVYVRIE